MIEDCITKIHNRNMNNVMKSSIQTIYIMYLLPHAWYIYKKYMDCEYHHSSYFVCIRMMDSIINQYQPLTLILIKYQQFTCNLWMHIWFVRIFFYNMRHRPINLSKHVYLVSINYMSIAQERFLSWKTKCYCYIKENIYGLQRMDYLHNYWVCLSNGNSN